MLNVTLNNIKGILKDFSIKHPLINNFYYGDVEGITNGETFIYPLLAVIPNNTTYPVSGDKDIIYKTYNMTILMMDKLNYDLSNRDDIWSDCNQLSEDLIAYLLTNEYFIDNKITIDNTINLTHFTERTTDKTAGNSFEIVLSCPFNSCVSVDIEAPINLYC
jgi:hypothetical protein